MLRWSAFFLWAWAACSTSEWKSHSSLCSCRRRALSSWRLTLILAVTSTFRLKCELLTHEGHQQLFCIQTGTNAAFRLMKCAARLQRGKRIRALCFREEFTSCLNSVLVFFSSISEDSSRMFVAVGYGFFVEMTHDEALRFIEKKTSQLTAWVHCHCNTIKIKSRRKKHKNLIVSDMFQMKVRISLCCEIIWKKYVRTIYFEMSWFCF